MANTAIKPRFLATGIGSMPFEDPVYAVKAHLLRGGTFCLGYCTGICCDPRAERGNACGASWRTDIAFCVEGD